MAATVSLLKSHCGQQFQVMAQHTYATSKTKQTYVVTVTITSKYGATKTLTHKICV